MRVMLLPNSGQIYSCNVYLVMGDWSAISDVNSLIDVGRDPAMLDSLRQAPTGVGKRAVEQVVLTHGHYDHVELVGQVKRLFHPTVCAFGRSEGVDRLLADGDALKAGDREFEVIHTPGHSSDSICLYCRQEGVLFAGDTPLLVNSTDGTYEEDFAAALEKLCTLNIKSIYFGHGMPLLVDCNARLQRSLAIVNHRVIPRTRIAQHKKEETL